MNVPANGPAAHIRAVVERENPMERRYGVPFASSRDQTFCRLRGVRLILARN